MRYQKCNRNHTCVHVYIFRRQILGKLKRGTMERAERGKSRVKSNNGVTYLLNDPPITFTGTSKPQLGVSIEFIRVRNSIQCLSYTRCF